MSSTTDRYVARGTHPLDEVGSFFDGILAQVSTWVPALGALFDDPLRPPSTKAVNAVTQPLAAGLINSGQWPVVGAGFVAAEHAIADAVWHMAWWQGEAMERLVLPAVASASAAYTRREWFTRPMDTGYAHVTGPYVDFLCTDEYTMTMTVPVLAGGRRVGVAGADVFVESLEPLLLPALRKLHPAAALVNHAGRVIVSAEVQVAAGTLLAPGAVPRTSDISAEDDAAMPSRGELEAPRFVQPRTPLHAGERLLVRPCGTLPLAVVHPSAG
ncbi:hypothetical protein FDK12_03810 [Arthrobacter sp. NamB2]|uniref:cache domain-containing protein n=1 Tax=Arthrobacter sp. NamB2 TaxID=2576035 RepID=UPI0010C9D3B3|nr:cache domain-containing protein [Arthrobacter sp. NamB2]TKV28809.1 hypothetical protein FDK12_03810 [Arthrobacter sp. NamB2]